MSEREEIIYQRAYELAMSGFHINPITLVTALVQEGFPEAAELLNSEITRADLRAVCARHWRGVAVSVEEPAAVLSAGPDGAPAGPLRLMEKKKPAEPQLKMGAGL